MTEPVAAIQSSVRLPREALLSKYGSFFFTSSLAWMFAMALDEIEESRRNRTTAEQDTIGLWGVDMAAAEEYGYQRAGCQFFVNIAQQKGIEVIVPPESDLLCPAPLYGVMEHSHMHIKLMARKRELENRLQAAEYRRTQANDESFFLKGAIDDMNYVMGTWLHDASTANVADFQRLFTPPAQVTESAPVSEMSEQFHDPMIAKPFIGNGLDTEEATHA
jgi:hypothetical protein